VLETHALTRRFGDLMAVDTLSMRVQAGHMFGLLVESVGCLPTLLTL
jgi:ABC-type uncharacterized transport system ATPase subunit